MTSLGTPPHGGRGLGAKPPVAGDRKQPSSQAGMMGEHRCHLKVGRSNHDVNVTEFSKARFFRKQHPSRSVPRPQPSSFPALPAGLPAARPLVPSGRPAPRGPPPPRGLVASGRSSLESVHCVRRGWRPLSAVAGDTHMSQWGPRFPVAGGRVFPVEVPCVSPVFGTLCVHVLQCFKCLGKFKSNHECSVFLCLGRAEDGLPARCVSPRPVSKAPSRRALCFSQFSPGSRVGPSSPCGARGESSPTDLTHPPGTSVFPSRTQSVPGDFCVISHKSIQRLRCTTARPVTGLGALCPWPGGHCKALQFSSDHSSSLGVAGRRGPIHGELLGSQVPIVRCRK